MADPVTPPADNSSEEENKKDPTPETEATPNPEAEVPSEADTSPEEATAPEVAEESAATNEAEVNEKTEEPSPATEEVSEPDKSEVTEPGPQEAAETEPESEKVEEETPEPETSTEEPEPTAEEEATPEPAVEETTEEVVSEEAPTKESTPEEEPTQEPETPPVVSEEAELAPEEAPGTEPQEEVVEPEPETAEPPQEEIGASPAPEAGAAPLASAIGQELSIQSTPDSVDASATGHYPISRIFLRFFAGFGAGLAGTMVWGLILFLFWSVVGDVLSPSDVETSEFGITLTVKKTHPLFLYVMVFAVFMATLVANLSHSFIMSVMEERYHARSTTLTHVFFGSLIILFFFLPAYMLGAGMFGPTGIGVAALLHIVCTALFAFFVLEIVAGTKHLLVHVYGAILGIALFFFIGNVLAGGNTTIASFLLLPLLLGVFGGGNGIAEGVYHWISQTYSNDFLHTEKVYGGDYGQDEDVADLADPDL